MEIKFKFLTMTHCVKATGVAISHMLDIYNLLQGAIQELRKDRCPNNAGREQVIKGLLDFYNANIYGAKLAYGIPGEVHGTYELGRIQARIQQNQTMVSNIVEHIKGLPNNQGLVKSIEAFKEQSDAFYKALEEYFHIKKAAADQTQVIIGADSFEISGMRVEQI